AVGLLAVGQNWRSGIRSPESAKIDHGKKSVVRAVRLFVHCDVVGAKARSKHDRSTAVPMEAGEYGCNLYYVHLADVMAGATCGLLSTSERSSANCRSYTGYRVPGWYQRARYVFATDKALCCHRLVLVFGNARSSNWPRPSRRASACGSLYVPA